MICTACGQTLPDTPFNKVARIARFTAQRLHAAPDHSESWSDLRRSNAARDRPDFAVAVNLLEERGLVSCTDARGGREVRLTDQGVRKVQDGWL